ncbi:MAG: arylsulfatase [Phycisphaerales bacterium]
MQWNATRGMLVAMAVGGLSASALAQAEGDAFNRAVRTADHLEPAIPNGEQDRQAAAKLRSLRERFGRPPNILILVADDMGWGDPGVYGGGIAVGAPTPTIDRMANRGLRLTSTYSQPTCTPTRAAIMTGRIPTRSGLTRPILTGEQVLVNPWEAEVSAAEILSGNGYTTALIGKWHVGEQEGMRPHEVGFDEYYGILSVVSEFSQQFDERLYPDLVLRPERMAAVAKLSEPAITKGVKGGPLEIAEELATTDDLGQLDQRFADASEDFIRRTVDADRPFYLVHAFSRVHNDNYPAEGYAGKSPAGFPYKDGIIEIDDITERLLGVLADTGQLENTLVFFTSDNGANEDLSPDAGFQPWRGGKGTTWEGGVRVPGIAYWPGTIAAGRQSDGLFDLCDLFNTSLAVAGLDIPSVTSEELYIDGVDQTSFLLADDGQSNREAVFMYSENTLMAVRWLEYKVHFRVFQTHAPRRNLDETTIAATGMSPWVYNLYMDPKEQASTGHSRFEWGIPQVLQKAGAHNATFEKFPRKDIGLRKP